jgi:hypothetical protein
MTNQKKQSSEAAVREIRRRSRRKFSPEEKIRIVLEGLRGEQSVSDLSAENPLRHLGPTLHQCFPLPLSQQIKQEFRQGLCDHYTAGLAAPWRRESCLVERPPNAHPAGVEVDVRPLIQLGSRYPSASSCRRSSSSSAFEGSGAGATPPSYRRASSSAKSRTSSGCAAATSCCSFGSASRS